MWTFVALLLALSGVARSQEIEFEYDDYANFESRTFNLSLDSLFNASALGVTGTLILMIVLFGKSFVRVHAFETCTMDLVLLQRSRSLLWTSTMVRRTATVRSPDMVRAPSATGPGEQLGPLQQRRGALGAARSRAHLFFFAGSTRRRRCSTRRTPNTATPMSTPTGLWAAAGALTSFCSGSRRPETCEWRTDVTGRSEETLLQGQCHFSDMWRSQRVLRT